MTGGGLSSWCLEREKVSPHLPFSLLTDQLTDGIKMYIRNTHLFGFSAHRLDLTESPVIAISEQALNVS